MDRLEKSEIRWFLNLLIVVALVCIGLVLGSAFPLWDNIEYVNVTVNRTVNNTITVNRTIEVEVEVEKEVYVYVNVSKRCDFKPVPCNNISTIRQLGS